MTAKASSRRSAGAPAAATDAPLSKELPSLLAERGLSLRAIARLVGVNQSHLSRVLGASDARPVSAGLAGDIAVALGLPRDYFPEYREGVVIEAVANDPQLREAVYRQLRSGRA